VHFYKYFIATMYARFLVRVSYLEIYNEEVRDLLGKDQTQRLEVRIFCFLVNFSRTLYHSGSRKDEGRPVI